MKEKGVVSFTPSLQLWWSEREIDGVVLHHTLTLMRVVLVKVLGNSRLNSGTAEDLQTDDVSHQLS